MTPKRPLPRPRIKFEDSRVIEFSTDRRPRTPDQWKEDARRLRREQTPEEARLWSYLRNRRLRHAKFRRQHHIGRFVADFCCLESRLIVEVDGSQHHDSRRDSQRTEWLNKQHFRVLRFSNHDVKHYLVGVLDTIAKELSDPHPGAKDAPDLSRR